MRKKKKEQREGTVLTACPHRPQTAVDLASLSMCDLTLHHLLSLSYLRGDFKIDSLRD